MGKISDPILEITEDGRRIFAYNAKGQPICYCLKNGKRCQSPFVSKNGRCKMHGGHMPSGIAHYNYQGVRLAENFPRHLQRDMIASKNDPDLLSLNFEIRGTDVSLKDLQQQLGGNGIDSSAWKKLKALADQLESAIDTDPDWERPTDIAKKMIDIIRTGCNDRSIRSEIVGLQEHRRKLVETAHRRERDNKTFLKAEQAMALISSLAGAVKQCFSRHKEMIEKKYTLIDKDTKKTVTRLDPLISTAFLQDVAQHMAKITGATTGGIDRDYAGHDTVSKNGVHVATSKALLPENADDDVIEAAYE